MLKNTHCQWVVLLLALMIQFGARAQSYYTPAWKNRQSGHPTSVLRLDNNASQGTWDSIERATYVYVPGSDDYTSISEQRSFGMWRRTGRYVATFDTAGRTLSLLVDYDSLGTWRPYETYAYTYDAFGIQTSYVARDYYLVPGDTMNASRATVTYGVGGMPVQIDSDRWTGPGGWVPDERHVLHYNGLLEQDTLRIYLTAVGMQLSETHVFHSWHDFSKRLVDSVTIHIPDPASGSYHTVKTHYNGLQPTQYHTTRNGGNLIISGRWIGLDANGFYEMDSSYQYLPTPHVLYNNCNRWGNIMNGPGGRRSEERLMRLDSTQSYFPRMTFFYEYDSTITQVAPQLPLDLHMWPNPATAELHVDFVAVGDVQLSLRDLQGRTRLLMVQPGGANGIRLTLPESLAAGTYVLEVIADGRKATRKVVVMR